MKCPLIILNIFKVAFRRLTSVDISTYYAHARNSACKVTETVVSTWPLETKHNKKISRHHKNVYSDFLTEIFYKIFDWLLHFCIYSIWSPLKARFWHFATFFLIEKKKTQRCIKVPVKHLWWIFLANITIYITIYLSNLYKYNMYIYARLYMLQIRILRKSQEILVWWD